jgi:hypothetical protein
MPTISGDLVAMSLCGRAGIKPAPTVGHVHSHRSPTVGATLVVALIRINPDARAKDL